MYWLAASHHRAASTLLLLLLCGLAVAGALWVSKPVGPRRRSVPLPSGTGGGGAALAAAYVGEARYPSGSRKRPAHHHQLGHEHPAHRKQTPAGGGRTKPPRFNLFLEKRESKQLLGIDVDLFYVKEGVINEYALRFPVPVPGNMSQLEFCWQNMQAESNVDQHQLNYNIDIQLDNPHAMFQPSLNIPQKGVVPDRVGSFVVRLSCTGRSSAEVRVTILVEVWQHEDRSHDHTSSQALGDQGYMQVKIQRKKVCLKDESLFTTTTQFSPTVLVKNKLDDVDEEELEEFDEEEEEEDDEVLDDEDAAVENAVGKSSGKAKSNDLPRRRKNSVNSANMISDESVPLGGEWATSWAFSSWPVVVIACAGAVATGAALASLLATTLCLLRNNGNNNSSSGGYQQHQLQHQLQQNKQPHHQQQQQQQPYHASISVTSSAKPAVGHLVIQAAAEKYCREWVAASTMSGISPPIYANGTASGQCATVDGAGLRLPGCAADNREIKPALLTALSGSAQGSTAPLTTTDVVSASHESLGDESNTRSARENGLFCGQRLRAGSPVTSTLASSYSSFRRPSYPVTGEDFAETVAPPSPAPQMTVNGNAVSTLGRRISRVDQLDAHRSILQQQPQLRLTPGSMKRSNGGPGGTLNSSAGQYSTIQDLSRSRSSLLSEQLSELAIDARYLSLKRVLGQGIFGKIYHAVLKDDDGDDDNCESQDLSRSRPGSVQAVLVKTLDARAASTNQVEEFMLEGMMLFGMNHANILPVVGTCLDLFGHPALIYPAMNEGNLKHFLIRNRASRGDDYVLPPSLAIPDLIEVGVQIAEGLMYLHKRFFLHKDVACRNCMLDERLHVKLADNALAKDIFPDDYCRSGEQERRPVGWLSIESLQSREFTPASDLWMFGVTLWELFSLAQQPYKSVAYGELIGYIRSGHRLPKPLLAPDELYSLMCRCWCLSPGDRVTLPQALRILADLYSRFNSPSSSSTLPHSSNGNSYVGDVGLRDIYADSASLGADSEEYCQPTALSPIQNFFLGQQQSGRAIPSAAPKVSAENVRDQERSDGKGSMRSFSDTGDNSHSPEPCPKNEVIYANDAVCAR